MGRMIGIRHRRKKTAEGKPSPTQVAMNDGGSARSLKLTDDQAELDFVHGRFPTKYRGVQPEDKPENFLKHQLVWRDLDPEKEKVEDLPQGHTEKRGRKTFVLSEVPIEFDGLKPDDTVGMVLGGSGDMLSYAIVRRAEAIGAKVLRITPFQLKFERGEESKEDDSALLAKLVATKPNLFYAIQSRDKDVIYMRECFRQRIDAMKARIACEQRFQQVFVGRIFGSDSLEVEIEKRFEEAKGNDGILQNMIAMEEGANKALAEAIAKLDIYQYVFEPLEGVGPQTAARLIAGIIDIRRFPPPAHRDNKGMDKFVSFCGTNSTPDGKFRRRRVGELSNWSPSCRQGLWLMISDQANKRPDSVWGKRLREIKAGLRAAHPEVVIENNKKRYTDGHIHKMAVWKTMTKLARFIYTKWWELERGAKVQPAPQAPPTSELAA